MKQKYLFANTTIHRGLLRKGELWYVVSTRGEEGEVSIARGNDLPNQFQNSEVFTRPSEESSQFDFSLKGN